MLDWRRTLTASAVALCGALALAQSASATTSATATLTAGTLGFINSTPANVTFSGTLNGANQTLTRTSRSTSVTRPDRAPAGTSPPPRPRSRRARTRSRPPPPRSRHAHRWPATPARAGAPRPPPASSPTRTRFPPPASRRPRRGCSTRGQHRYGRPDGDADVEPRGRPVDVRRHLHLDLDAVAHQRPVVGRPVRRAHARPHQYPPPLAGGGRARRAGPHRSRERGGGPIDRRIQCPPGGIEPRQPRDARLLRAVAGEGHIPTRARRRHQPLEQDPARARIPRRRGHRCDTSGSVYTNRA